MLTNNKRKGDMVRDTQSDSEIEKSHINKIRKSTAYKSFKIITSSSQANNCVDTNNVNTNINNRIVKQLNEERRKMLNILTSESDKDICKKKEELSNISCSNKTSNPKISLLNTKKCHKRKSNCNIERNSNTDYPLRLTERHFPSACNSKGAKQQLRQCIVCAKNDKRRRSRYCCTACNVGLCVEPCFEIYHTQLYF